MCRTLLLQAFNQSVILEPLHDPSPSVQSFRPSLDVQHAACVCMCPGLWTPDGQQPDITLSWHANTHQLPHCAEAASPAHTDWCLITL